MPELSNVRLCDVREFIRTPDDLWFNDRHYSRKVYRGIADSLAKQTQSIVRVVERGRLAKATHNMLRLRKAPDLLARGVRVLRNPESGRNRYK